MSEKKNGNEPFEEFAPNEPPAPQGERPPEGGKSEKKKKKRASPAKKIATAAVGTALAVVMITLTCYLPLTVLPLVMISLCFNIVTERCGVWYGFASALAAVGLGFLVCAGNIAVMLIVVVVFVPYSVLCFCLRRLDYGSVKKALLRAAIVVAYASLDLFFVFLLGELVAAYAPLEDIFARIGGFAVGYAVCTLVFDVLFVCIDWMFVLCGKWIVRKLK